jgi:hypothetical protein
MLIEAMEHVSQQERGTAACDPSVLAKVRAQLQRPASPYRNRVSRLDPLQQDRI